MALVGSEKSKTVLFFVVSQILVILALYTLYDEAVVRRPWKHFQGEFNRLELQVASQNYNKIYKKFIDDGTDKKIKKLQLDLEQAITAKESTEYKKLTSQLKDIQIKFDDEELEIKFNKSVLDAYYYDWKHAFQSGHEYQKAQEKYINLDKKTNQQKEELKGSEADLEKVKSKVKVYNDKIAGLKEKIEQLKKPLQEAQIKIDNVAFRTDDIKQVVISDLGIQGNIYWGKVDRCQTCHLVSDESGFEDIVKAFNLVVVKDTTALKDYLMKNPAQKGMVITEDQKKHYQIMYGTHPKRDILLAQHPVEHFGCTSCHGGDGRALRIKGLSFGSLDGRQNKKEDENEEMGSTSAYVQGVFGEGDLVHATHHHGIEPLLRGIQEESNCLSCHRGQIYVPDAKRLTQGLNLFVDLGCNGCHLVNGYGDLYKVGPDLSKVASKVDKTWLVDWIKNPKNYMPNSRMPMFNMVDDQVVALASFLISNSKEYQIKFQSALNGDVENGKNLFDTIGCLGCHSADNSKETYSKRNRAPNLSRLAAKIKDEAWVYDWIKNPKNYSQHARMPNLRLTDNEAADIATYLLSQNLDYKEVINNRSGKLAALINPTDKELVQKGKNIIIKRGCYSCHNIRGFEGFDRIAPELTGFALKETFELDFGDAFKKHFTFLDAFKTPVYVAHRKEPPGVTAADAIKGITPPKDKKMDRVTNLVETWQSWTRNKLKYPTSIYNHKRAELLMPNYNLNDEELDALVAFLKSLQKKIVPLRYNASKVPYMSDVIAGQRLVAKYNCLGCHSISGYGAEITAHIDKQMGAKLTQFYPPSLDHVGEKIRPEWLYGFLKEPQVYRPQVKVRMPTYDFDDKQTNTLMRFFAGMSKVDHEITEVEYMLKHENLVASDVLGGPEAYNCFSCHFLNGKPPSDDPRNWAPDWALMKDRLQYDFIIDWIKNPVKYQKFAVMPAYLNADDEAHPDYFGGSAAKQLEALRDYVLSGGKTVVKKEKK